MKINWTAIFLLLVCAPVFGAQTSPSSDECSYLLDVYGVSRASCAKEFQIPNDAPAAAARQNALDRKNQVLDLARRISSADNAAAVQAVFSDSKLKLDPPLNPRTFTAWLASDAASQARQKVSSYLRWIAAKTNQGKAINAEGSSETALLEKFAPELAKLSGALSDPAAAARAFDGSLPNAQNIDLAGNETRSQAPRLASSAAPQSGSAASQVSAPPAPPSQSVNPLASFWDQQVNSKDDPCANFFQYACSNWNAAHPVPPDESSWGTFNALNLRNESDLRQILEAASHGTGLKDPDEAKLGDFYASCMDQKSADAAGAKPIKPELDRIAAIGNKSGLAQEAAHLNTIGIPVLFSFGASPDDMNAKRQIAVLDQGGFTLPNRSYYLDGDFASVRQDYAAHVTKMFELLGDSPKDAAAEESAVMGIETALAQASMDSVSRRSPASVYHMQKTKAFEKTSPTFDWKGYFSGLQSPSFSKVNVADPGFFKGLDSLISYEPLSAWKSYLRWQVLDAEAPFLSKDFVDENFAFNGRELSGQQQMSPRWRTCVSLADSMMGDALGRLYVKQYFPAASEKTALGMVKSEESAMGANIRAASWMDAKTKTAALKKLSMIQNNIGYPNKWTNYDSLQIDRGNLVENIEQASAFATKQDVGEIGQKTDRRKWEMTPPTVNAYYDPAKNNINFPAGILQPPFFQSGACLAQNLGSIGMVIGHEMTHAFDDQGSQYDGSGNRKNWWTPKDQAAFKQKTQCLVNEYSQFTAVMDPSAPKNAIKVNGELTLGENTADNGGMRVAYAAMQNALTQHQAAACDAGHWTNDQIFFLSYAQVWCGSDTPQAAKMLANDDPHSPAQARVNGVLQNMTAFQKAFNCPANSPMVSPNACRVW